MNDLQRFYREALAAQIDELQAARAAAATGDERAVASIRQAVHRLRGSGGTYGFPEITMAADAAGHDCDPADAAFDRLIDVLRAVAGLTPDAADGTARGGPR